MKHTWVISGRDYSTAVPNVWSCLRCGMFRAANYDRPNCGHMEYSNPDGEVIDHRKKEPPACRPKENTHDDDSEINNLRTLRPTKANRGIL